METPAQTEHRRWWPWILVLGTLIVVAGAKFRLIAFFGSDIPFGDQWYGELTTTYAPYLRGQFGWRELFAPHFEHRIVWTRLLDLGLLELNGRWDPRLQLLVNVLLPLTAVAILLRHVVRDLAPLPAALAAGFIAFFFGSEALWENTLWGFQSQFYFLLIFSLVHVTETSTARPWSPAWWVGHAAGLANLFSMAGGALSAAAVLGWLAWRRWRCDERHAGDAFTAIWNLALVATSALLWPAMGIFRHGSAHPGPLEILYRICDVLSWPGMDWRLGLLVWAPAIGYLFRQLLSPARRFGPAWLLPVTLLALSFIAVVVYARGGALASRYSDFYALGVFANLICALAWPASGPRAKLKLVLALAWAFLLTNCLSRSEQKAYFYTLVPDLTTRQQEAERIRTFLRMGETAPMLARPAFDEHQMTAFELVRTTPALRDILPYSLQEPKAIVAAKDAPPAGFSPEQLPAIPGLPPGMPAWGSYGSTVGEACWTSAPLTSRHSFLVFYVAGEIKPPLTSLTLLTADGRTVAPLKTEVHAAAKWVRVNFANPGQSFQIEARDANPTAAFAFAAPLEQSRLSWLVPKVVDSWIALQIAGWLLLAGAALVPLLAWLRADD